MTAPALPGSSHREGTRAAARGGPSPPRFRGPDDDPIPIGEPEDDEGYDEDDDDDIDEDEDGDLDEDG